MIDTADTLLRIVVKPFELKNNVSKLQILRKLRQAYITGLPNEMSNEDLLEFLADFGDVFCYFKYLYRLKMYKFPEIIFKKTIKGSRLYYLKKQKML